MKGNGTSTQRTNHELVSRAQHGDDGAFRELHRIHNQRVYKLCLRMTGNTADAEDLTQEAFLQLFRRIETFRGESTFSTWLHRLVYNEVLMSFRKRKLPTIPLKTEFYDDEGEVVEYGVKYEDLRLKGALDRMVIVRAMEELPDGYRTIFILHDIEGYEHNEIAGLLDCSIGTSKSQLHRARIKLRETISARIRHNA